jgi:hypothetical protein
MTAPKEILASGVSLVASGAKDWLTLYSPLLRQMARFSRKGASRQ